MEDSSAELAAFVDRVLAATGAAKVDLVGHSEGTVMPQYYLKFRGGAAKVDKYVAITPIYKGTTLLTASARCVHRVRDGLPAVLGDPISTSCRPAQCGSCQEFLDRLRLPTSTSTPTASTRCPASRTRRS